ncbi:hypothetical protein CLU79DRAFT_753529 [Phycomyces nitens]|nr:hypothetical protein CLU79DRAFT_753529 [Phycomyces nitens]
MLSTERKDKNRLAQAAFRARREKYSRQRDNALLKLEARINQLEKSHQEAINRANRAEENCINLSNELYHVQQQLSLALTENECWRSCLDDQWQSLGQPCTMACCSPDFAPIDPLPDQFRPN